MHNRKVHFTEEELRAPNLQIITRHPNNPAIITRIDRHPAVARHQKLAAKLAELGRVYMPHANE